MGEVMDSKRLNARDISRILGIDEPRQINGGTVEKEWVVEAVSKSPGCEEVNLKLNKIPLLESAVLALGGEWDDTCYSDGSTITAIGLSRYGICLEPRLVEMRGVWSLLGKEGYPEVDHDQFVSVLYTHFLSREMTADSITSIQEILTHIDENHGLSDDEISIEGEPTDSTYQVILNNLFDNPSEDEVEENDDMVRRIIDTEVDATQIATLVNYYRRGVLNLNPPWQRGDVWSPKKKKAVIESILLNIPLPAIILHILPHSPLGE